MKKILTIMLLALLVIFTGCDSGETSASDEEQALAEQYAQMIASGMVSSTSELVTTPTGVEQGLSRAAVPYSYYENVDVNPDTQTFSGYFTITFDYNDSDASLTGNITYTLSGSWDASNVVTAEGTYTGNLTITSGTESYTLVFALEMYQSGSSASVSGYITINGAKATIDMSV